MSEVFYSSMMFKKNCRQGAAATQDEDVTYSEVKVINPTASNTVCHGGSAEHRGQSSHLYRRVAVSLGLLCALLLAATVVLCVLYTSLSENYSKEKELRSNCSTMNTEKVQLQSNVSNRCPQGWAQFSSKCYYFSNEMKNWTDSRSDCEERGADLVIIESDEEQRFINKQIKEYTWIGLSYSVDKGNWLWVNGTPLQKGFWGHGEPDVFECALFVRDENAWITISCIKHRNFTCETTALLS